MAKNLNEETIKEIKNKLKEYQATNMEIVINPNDVINSFDRCIEEAKKDTSGYAATDVYKSFYASILKKGMVASAKSYGVQDEPYIFTIENFNNYEKLMRGLFDSYVKPEIQNDGFALSAYGFGGLFPQKFTSIANHVKDINAYDCYQARKTHDNTNPHNNIVEDIDEYREIYTLNNTSINHAQQASYMALLYKDLHTQYNEMSKASRWFTKAGWSRWWTLKQAKSYIQERRSDTEKNETSFDEYINTEANSTVVDYSAIETAAEDIKDMLTDVLQKWGIDSNYDPLEQDIDSPLNELYGELSENEERNNDFDVNENSIEASENEIAFDNSK